MKDTYKKKDKDTLTVTHVTERTREDLELEIRGEEEEIVEAQNRVDALKAKIAILDK